MAESLSSARKSNPRKFLTEMEMAAAQLLMQLSDEDSNNNNKKTDTDDEEVEQSRTDVTSAMIEEIFGKEEVYRPKKRRYRTIDSIYTETKPMNARHWKKVRSYRNVLNRVLA